MMQLGKFARIAAVSVVCVSVAACTSSTDQVGSSSSPSVPALDSKLPQIVVERIRQIAVAINPDGKLDAQEAARLSDRFVTVNGKGELRLEFHAAAPITSRQLGNLRALGATTLSHPTGPARLVEVWIPHARVGAAAALPWVVAVRPSELSPPDSEGGGA